jgi:Sulfotransferase family
MTERIRDAVVIHGPGRSGTTLLSRILSTHSDFAWISGYVSRFPDYALLAVFNRVLDIDPVERRSRDGRWWPRPAEAYQFWNHFFPLFSDPATRSKAPRSDRPAECIETIRKIVRYHGKRRFITKITGAPRADELAVVFEDPHVVYIHRDPRAVVASYYKQRWGYKNRPDTFAEKTETELLQEYARRYEMSFEGRKALMAFRYVDLSYEQMVAAPEPFFRRLFSRLGLPEERRFFDRLASWKLQQQTNEAWRKQLSEKGAAFLDESLKDYVTFTAGLERVPL